MVIPMVDVADHTRRLGSALRASAGDVHSERSVTTMDCAMHPLLARCVRRRVFVVCTTEAEPARATGGGGASCSVLGRRPLFKGGVVTPRPPCRLPATYSRSNCVRSASAFLGLAKEGQRA
jgi:hypothetical protein